MAANINPVAPLNLHNVLTAIGLDFSEWYHLGVFLKIEDNELDAIAAEFPSVRMRCTKMVQKWLNSEDGATWEDLCEALRKLGQHRLAETILTKYYGKDCDPILQQGSSIEKQLIRAPLTLLASTSDQPADNEGDNYCTYMYKWFHR